MSVQGSPELRARLRSLRLAFKPLGKSWAEDTRDEARRRIAKKTGKTAASIRVRNASQRKATVVGSYIANFIDAGTAAHDESPKKAKTLRFVKEGRTICAKKVHHPRVSARPFKRASALEGLRKNPMALEVIRQWNEAAR